MKPILKKSCIWQWCFGCPNFSGFPFILFAIWNHTISFAQILDQCQILMVCFQTIAKRYLVVNYLKPSWSALQFSNNKRINTLGILCLVVLITHILSGWFSFIIFHSNLHYSLISKRYHIKIVTVVIIGVELERR